MHDMIAARLKGFQDKLVKVGIESGSFRPHLHRAFSAMGFAMMCMDARRAADAIKSRSFHAPPNDRHGQRRPTYDGSHHSAAFD